MEHVTVFQVNNKMKLLSKNLLKCHEKIGTVIKEESELYLAIDMRPGFTKNI